MAPAPMSDPRRHALAAIESGVAELQALADNAMPSEGPAPDIHDETAYLPPVTELGRVTTARLLPTRYSDSVLTRIAASEEDLPALYALDNATNERLQAESGHGLQVMRDELVFQGAYARIVNAAFTHPHPLGARFSTPFRGAWYSGFELATAKAEVMFHRALQFEEIAWAQPESLDYDHYVADFMGPFYDLRPPAESGEAEAGQVDQSRDSADAPGTRERDAERAARTTCLDPASYVRSQALAVRLLARNAQGVVYPSARRTGGTCLACFQPRSVHAVRKRDLHRLTWYPDRPPTFRRVPRQ